MLLECVLKRKNGSTVDLDGDVYRFVPNENNDHVCEVPHQEHINLLLEPRMNGSYQVYGKYAQEEYKWKQMEKDAAAKKADSDAANKAAADARREAQKAAKELEAREQRIANERAEKDIQAKKEAEAVEESKAKIEASKAAQRQTRSAKV